MFSNILVAFDGSDHAKKALEVGTAMALKFDASLHLMHVMSQAHASEKIAEFASAEHVEDADALEEKSTSVRVLEPMVRKLQTAGVKDVQADVLRGDPAQEVLDYAGQSGVDLIVLGRRGLGRMEGLLVGSVSSKVSAHAACPVLTVK